jgi:hypothetical protein
MDASVDLQFAGTARRWCSHVRNEGGIDSKRSVKGVLEPQFSTAATDNGTVWRKSKYLLLFVKIWMTFLLGR